MIITESGRPARRCDEADAAVSGFDTYNVRLGIAPAAGTKVYVTVSAARSNDEEDAQGGDSVLITTSTAAAPTTPLLLRDVDGDGVADGYYREIFVDGQQTFVGNRTVVLVFDSTTNYQQDRTVYVVAAPDTLAEGERVVTINHAVDAALSNPATPRRPRSKRRSTSSTRSRCATSR